MIEELTPKQADNVIRASWPLTAHRANGCDYTAHTAECNVDDDTDALPGPPMAALFGIGLVVLVAFCAAVLMFTLRVPS